jgi:peptidyl-prolyl cis-trans isomerase B (cyclophilin B)
MAKRRKQTAQRSHVYQAGEVKPGFSRRQPPTPPKQSGPPWTWIIVGAVGIVAALVLGAYALGYLAPGSAPTPRPSIEGLQPPAATPLASPLAEPAGDGTTATISTELGDITFELFNESAPVASENFENLANAGFYDGTVFHRIVPDFMIQGGDPEGTGGGGPGYTIPDEPFSGSYDRGIVAMARTSAPNSQGSQFFIVVKDSPFLAGGGYTIFGRVTDGMDVVDEIVSGPSANDEPQGVGGTALEPVVMDEVTIQTP